VTPPTLAAFAARPLPAELRARWLQDGHGVDETIGQLLDRELAVTGRTAECPGPC
jgi:hypothetical protein